MDIKILKDLFQVTIERGNLWKVVCRTSATSDSTSAVVTAFTWPCASWSADGSRDLSDPWTGFTQFTLLEEKPPDGYMWSGGEINEETAYIQPRSSWPELWTSMGKECQAKGEAKVV